MATLDMDATLVETGKAEALYCYKHFKAYQPLNTWWAEHGVVLHSEFRDGNVPAGHQQLRVFKAALGALPPRLRPQLYALGASRLQMLWLVLQEARLPLLAALMAGFGAAISEIGASLALY